MLSTNWCFPYKINIVKTLILYRGYYAVVNQSILEYPAYIGERLNVSAAKSNIDSQ
jgi:hypothetical protein